MEVSFSVAVYSFAGPAAEGKELRKQQSEWLYTQF
jgi:hypothetical protein